MIVAAIQASFFAWSFYAWQPYFLDLLGRPEAVWVAGVIAALVSLATMIGNGLVERLARYCARRTTLLIWAMVVQIGAAIGLWLSNSIWSALPCLLVFMGATGVSHPVTQAYLHRLIPGNERATIISFNSMISSAGSMVGQGALGRIAQVRSIAAGYATGGVFLLFSLPTLFVLRRFEGAGDELEGQAGTKSTCAAQGLPSVAAIDPKAASY
jgi:predicted MFS family arabinose efflux permease